MMTTTDDTPLDVVADLARAEERNRLADALDREADTYTGMEALAKEAGDTMSTLNFQGAAFALRDVARRIRAGEFPKEAPTQREPSYFEKYGTMSIN